MTTPQLRTRSANHEGRTGTTARPQTVEALVREAGRVLADHDVSLSRSKVSSLVRTYLHRMGLSGCTFADYIAANVPMHTSKRHVVAEDLRRATWAGFDPTGNDAAWNVDQEVNHVAQ